jgi:hypothetical protein
MPKKKKTNTAFLKMAQAPLKPSPQLAEVLGSATPISRCDQVLGDGSTSQVKMTGDLAHRPVFGPVQAMNRVDLFRGQHDSAATV